MRTRSLATLFTLAALTACSAAASTANLPDPTYDAPKTSSPGNETVVLAGVSGACNRCSNTCAA
jgi:hypothetical protein